MKVCECGAVKWKGSLSKNLFQCLKCYKKYTRQQLSKLSDKKEKP